jgi:hypothetical protein
MIGVTISIIIFLLGYFPARIYLNEKASTTEREYALIVGGLLFVVSSTIFIYTYGYGI